MRMAPHCGTVTPVMSLPHDRVMVCLPDFARVASIASTGALAAAPIFAPLPAATWTRKSRKNGCASSAALIA